MARLKLLGLATIVLAAVFFWFTFTNTANKPNKGGGQNNSPSPLDNSDQNTGGALGVKDFINNQISSTSDGINSYVEDKKRAVAEALLGQNPKQPVSVSVVEGSNSAPGSPQANFTIDVQNDQNLNLNFSKNNRYFLNFKNVPASFCLYVGDSQYPIDDSKTLLLQFSSTGSFTVRTNLCDLNFKNIGQFVVN